MIPLKTEVFPRYSLPKPFLKIRRSQIPQFPGSHKYQGEWSQLDQIIVNRDLITQESSMHIIPESIHIFAPDFLLTKDKTWRGVRPFRTYYGFKYEGGFSDHLPLTVDFLIRSQIKR